MIKANELRVGNLVKGAMDKVYTVDANIISICSRSPDWVDPIPLTPEILEEAGFVKDEQAGNWHNPDAIIYKEKKSNFKVAYSGKEYGWYNYSDDDFYSSVYPVFKYLHQLQNFYFAYDGTELEINL